MGARLAECVAARAPRGRCRPRRVIGSDTDAGRVPTSSAYARVSGGRCARRGCVSVAGSGAADIMNPIDTSVFVSKFVEEARDRIKALGVALLRLEQTPGAADAIAHALRESHSIKGSALMLGFTDISEISHQLEDLFVAAKTNASLLDGDAFDVIFTAVDRMSMRVEQLARGNTTAIE